MCSHYFNLKIFLMFTSDLHTWDTWEDKFCIECNSSFFRWSEASICLKTNLRNWIVFWNMTLWLTLGNRWVEQTSSTSFWEHLTEFVHAIQVLLSLKPSDARLSCEPWDEKYLNMSLWLQWDSSKCVEFKHVLLSSKWDCTEECISDVCVRRVSAAAWSWARVVFSILD